MLRTGALGTLETEAAGESGGREVEPLGSFEVDKLKS